MTVISNSRHSKRSCLIYEGGFMPFFLNFLIALQPETCGFSLLSLSGAAHETKDILRNERAYETSFSVFICASLISLVN